jgi:hypothetical protein
MCHLFLCLFASFLPPICQRFFVYLFCFFIFWGSAEIWTQGLSFAIFSDTVSHFFLPQMDLVIPLCWLQATTLPNSASQVTGIIGMSHQAWAYICPFYLIDLKVEDIIFIGWMATLYNLQNLILDNCVKNDTRRVDTLHEKWDIHTLSFLSCYVYYNLSMFFQYNLGFKSKFIISLHCYST